jgi:hypothetical protein
MGGVRISERKGEHFLQIPASMDGMKFRAWLKTSPGILSKDFLDWLRERNNPVYLMAKSENFKSAVRLISEEEIERFAALRLINGKIGNSYYMHVKTVPANMDIRENERYIEEKDEDDMDSVDSEGQENEKKSNSPKSKSLFK